MHRRPSSDWHISCEGIDLPVSYIAQSFRQFSATLSNVVHLKLEVGPMGNDYLEITDDLEWLHLLCQFSSVQFLYVSQDLTRRIAFALEDINVEMAAEVLPSLDLVYLEGQLASSVEKFVAARQISDRPVTVIDAKVEFSKRLRSTFGE